MQQQKQPSRPPTPPPTVAATRVKVDARSVVPTSASASHAHHDHHAATSTLAAAIVGAAHVAPAAPLIASATPLMAAPMNLRSASGEGVTTSALLPLARNGHASFVLDRTLYIFGGKGTTTQLALLGESQVPKLGAQSSSDPTLFNDLMQFSPDTGLWTQITTTGELPPPRAYFASALVASSYFYVMGGVGRVGGLNALLNDTYRLDLKKMEWEVVSVAGVVPNARYGHTASYVVGHYLFYYGGREKDHRATNDISFFDLETSRFIPVLSPLPSRFGHVVITHGSWLLVLGGDEITENPLDAPIFWVNLANFPKIFWQLDTTLQNPFSVPLGALVGASVTKTPLGLVLFGGRVKQNAVNDLVLIREKAPVQKEVAGEPEKKKKRNVRFGEQRVRVHQQAVMRGQRARVPHAGRD